MTLGVSGPDSYLAEVKELTVSVIKWVCAHACVCMHKCANAEQLDRKSFL